jgi:ketosteroid isomerase-like protein
MIDALETAQPSPESAIADVRALNEEYISAAAKGDASWFRAHMDEDVVVILGDGARMTKEAFLARTASQPHRVRGLTVRDVTVRVFGSMAQVDADAPWELDDGRRGVSRYIDTYAWLDGRWRVVSAQVTLLPADGER